MELFKNFQFGGLFQAGKRMAAPWGSFKRFTNSYKDATDTILPYGRGPDVSNAPSVPAANGTTGFTHLGILASQFYRRGILQFHSMRSGSTDRGVFSYLGADNSLVSIMQPFKVDTDKNSVEIENHMSYHPSSNHISCTVARKAYLSSLVNISDFTTTKPVNSFTPEESWLMAFDGLRLRGAGLPLPWTHIDPSGAAGSFYSRVVYATLGMDGEVIFSPYYQQRLSSATRDIYLGGYTAYPATPVVDVTSSSTFPTSRRPEDHLFERLHTSYGFGTASSNLRYFDKRFITSYGSASVTTGELSIVRGDYSSALDVGDWVMLDLGSPYGTIPASLYMFQIKTLAATTVFEKNIKYFDQNTVSWVNASFQDIHAEWNAIDVDIALGFEGVVSDITFTNIFMIVAYSTSASSGFVVHKILPIAWDSAQTEAGSVLSSAKTFTVPWAGVVSSSFSDWFDDTQVKTTFPPVKGITNYKELLVGFDPNFIYFSDISLGGSTEMVSGLSNIAPNGSEFGDIVAICGSEEFLFISRERRNYVITGDIAGSSFNITECDDSISGAYNARCVSNAWAGQVIFMNPTGVYSVNSSGAIKDISRDIKGLFLHTNRDRNLFDKSVFKKLATTRSSGFDLQVFKILLEPDRKFVIFLTTSVSTALLPTAIGSNMLVLDTRDGKWYEFEGKAITSAEVMDGKIISLGVLRAKEDGTMRSTEKQLLVTQGLTVDVPSLEKQILQLKLYGDITASDGGVSGLTIGQQNDWLHFNGSDRNDWNTNVVYTPETHEVYFHKKRLDSSKPLVTSIIIESISPSGSFTLEGMEIEGVVVQSGMKK